MWIICGCGRGFEYSLHLDYAPYLWRSTCYTCASAVYTRCFSRTPVCILMSLLAAELKIPQDFYSSLKCLCGTIFPILYSMVWDGGFQGQSQCFFIGLSCSLLFCLLLFSRSLLSFYKLILCSWGRRTDRV